MIMFTIYAHQNKINNKIYIGQTSQTNLNNRWKNGLGYKTCTYFYRAIQKYGWDNFEHLILEQGEWTQEEANQKEQFYILQYDSTNPEKGYNLIDFKQQKISPKANQKAVEWMKQHPEFGLARVQEMLEWQQKHPEEMLAMRRINAQKAANARKKAVQCIETGVVYESASEAARANPNTSQSKICMVCRGQRNTCGGLHWKYYDE